MSVLIAPTSQVSRRVTAQGSNLAHIRNRTRQQERQRPPSVHPSVRPSLHLIFTEPCMARLCVGYEISETWLSPSASREAEGTVATLRPPLARWLHCIQHRGSRLCLMIDCIIHPTHRQQAGPRSFIQTRGSLCRHIHRLRLCPHWFLPVASGGMVAWAQCLTQLPHLVAEGRGQAPVQTGRSSPRSSEETASGLGVSVASLPPREGPQSTPNSLRVTSHELWVTAEGPVCSKCRLL